jgi:hypothetical protein
LNIGKEGSIADSPGRGNRAASLASQC